MRLDVAAVGLDGTLARRQPEAVELLKHASVRARLGAERDEVGYYRRRVPHAEGDGLRQHRAPRAEGLGGRRVGGLCVTAFRLSGRHWTKA